MKKKLRQLMSALICLCLLVGMLPIGGLTVFAASTDYPSFATWKAEQTTPEQVEFEFTLYSTPKEGTTYKVYGEEKRLSEVGSAVLKENTDKTLVVTLNTAPSRDTRYFISATAPGCDESIYSGVVIVYAYDYATSLGYSYGDYEDLTYSEFYQDELNYKIVLPTGTASDAPISLNITTANGATVIYSGDENLTNGSGAATATVSSADNSFSQTYTVEFSTMELKGEGTEENPYLISTADELLQLAICHNSGAAAPMDVDGCGHGNHCGYYFKQTKNLNMESIAWEPIGHSGSTYFAGNFDGNGYTISNLTSTGKTNKDSYDCTLLASSGLFGWVAFGKISKVTVRNAQLSATGFGEIAYVGGLMGVAFGCTVENCSVYDSTITSYRTPNNSNFAGGLAGTVYIASFDRCSSIGNTVRHGSYGGGLIGSNDDDTTPFTNCLVADCAIIGYSQTGSIGTESGAVMGASQGGTTDLTNCFAYNCKTIKDEASLGYGNGGIFSGASRDVTDGDIVTSNTYYYDTNNTDVNDNTATAKTEEEFRDGTVLALLGDAFVQGEKYPIIKPITPPHSHEYTYSLLGNDTITATCVNADESCPNTVGGSVKIVAPTNAVYTGGAIEAVVENTLTTGDSVNVVYAPTDKLTDGKPVNAGTYTASVTLGDVTASTTFEIKKATPNIGTVGVNGTVTDQMKPGEVTLTRTDTTVAGALTLTDSELLANKSEYNWQFVPNDTANYEIVTGTVNIKVSDTQKPNADISFKTNKWNKFLNTVTFGLFFKDMVEVTVTASDNENGSGVKTVEYLLSETVITDEGSLPTEGWAALSTNGGKFNIEPNKKTYVYVRVTDNDGNVTVANSEGVVVYTNSTIADENKEIRYTVGSESGVSATVTLNGNTVKEIKNGDTVLAATDYTVDENGKITFGKDYLNTLAIGKYALTVSFNPLGVEYKENEGNEAPATVTITLTVNKNLPENLVSQSGTLTYNGSEQTPAVNATETADGKTIAYTYSTVEDGEYTADLPKFTNAGTYTVYYKANAEYHNEGSGSFTVTVEKQTVTEPTIESKGYTGMKLTAEVPESDLYTVVTNEGGINKGSYDVVLELNDPDNYKWKTTDEKTVTLTFTVTAADNSWTVAPSIDNWTYGDTANAPAYEAKFGSVSVTYTSKAADGTDYSGTTAPTKAGAYTATFAVAATEDYGSLSKTVDFKIQPRKVTVTAENAGKTYGDNDPTKFNWNVTDGNVITGDGLGITVSRESGENVKTYGIIIDKSNANKNYDITAVNGTFTIKKATLTVTADNKTATYGDKAPKYTVSYNGFKFTDNAESLGGTLAFDCKYQQFSDKGEYTITPKGYTSDNYDITYVDGKLTVSPKAITVTINKATSIYGDNIAELIATDNGIVNGDTGVYKLTTSATSASNVGKYDITGAALDSNYDITFTGGTNAYEITKRGIVIKVEAKNTIVNTALPAYTYKVEGLVGEDKLITEPTLTSNADITVIGEYDITASGADAGGNYTIKYVPAKLTVLTDNAVDAANGYKEELKDFNPDTVTSEDKEELTKMLDEIGTILDNDDITDNGKKALEEVKEQVEELLKEIDDAEKAANSETTETVKDVTAENVKPENKTNLEQAKKDLEKALEEHGSNYTEDEKKAIEDEIKRIDEALEVIGRVEKVKDLINKLPDTIKKSDADAVKAADDAYNALSDYEKSLVDKDAKKALDDAKAALEELNSNKSPATGDNSNMFLWIALLFVSGGAVATLTVVSKKKKKANR